MVGWLMRHQRAARNGSSSDLKKCRAARPPQPTLPAARPPTAGVYQVWCIRRRAGVGATAGRQSPGGAPLTRDGAALPPRPSIPEHMFVYGLTSAFSLPLCRGCKRSRTRRSSGLTANLWQGVPAPLTCLQFKPWQAQNETDNSPRRSIGGSALWATPAGRQRS